MTPTRIAINGFGRIGRAFFRASWSREEIEVVAINDLGDINNIAYLLKYDSVYRKAPFSVDVRDGDDKALIIDGREVKFVSERDPAKLPWGDYRIDIVVESTGVFASYAKSRAHLEAGAKRVVISAPVKDDPPADIVGATVLMGINDHALEACDISSNASCTTNSAAPVVQILNEAVGIRKAILNTVHGYTASQALVDAPDAKDFRRGRAAATNIIPASTGAALAVTKAVTELVGKFDGIALRVPVIAGSIADITFLASRNTSVEEVNNALKVAAEEERWSKMFSTTEEPIVSSDILGGKYASVADLSMTRVVDGDLVKILAWYDNEMGYVSALVEHVIASGKYVK